MKVKNNLNSGITLTLKDGNMCVLKASSTKVIKDELLTDEFNRLEQLGYIALIEEVKEEVKEAKNEVSADEKTTSETSNPQITTKRTNKGGKR